MDSEGLIVGRPLVSIVIGIVLVIAGVCLALFVGKPILDNAKASTEWPTAEGTVTQSKVTESRKDGDTMYTAKIGYEYQVDDKKYSSDRISFGGAYSSNSRSEHEEIAIQYPRNSRVKVFYKPDDPTTAVLEPGTTGSSYVALGCGIVLAVVGLAAAGIPLMIAGTAIFSGGGRANQSPWHDSSMTRSDSGGWSEPRHPSGSTPPAASSQDDSDDDGIDIG